MSVRPRAHVACLWIAVALGLVSPAAAQPAPPAPLEGTTPRAALLRYLQLCRAGDFAAASAYLELDAGTAPRAEDLAIRLKAVLDRHAWLDLEKVSNTADGARDDGLPDDAEQVARLPGPGGVEEPVRLHRSTDGVWRFAAATVARIDVWYRSLGGRWFLEHLPAWSLRPGPYDLLWWQWIVLPALLLVAWILGSILARLTRAVVGHIVRKTQAQWDDHLLDSLAGPLRWVWAVLLIRAVVPLLGLYTPAERSVGAILRAALFLVFFWAVVRFIDVVAQAVMRSTWAMALPASRALVPLGSRVAKAVIVVIAVISLLSQLGYPVASLIAGLGIGGIALALAAQKTVENLFGAFSIGVDQPFREGDFVKIEDFTGTVEAVGLRSTRIRTPDRTVVTLPNAKVAEARVESFAERDRIRFAHTIGLVYETTGGQMRQILEGFERVLRDHPRIWPETVIVRFQAFGAHSLDIEVVCWFVTTSYDEYRVYREEVLLGFMSVVERAGSAFAFPTATVHMVDGARAKRVDPPLPDRSAGGVMGEDDTDDSIERPAQGGAAGRADGDDPEPDAPPPPEPAP